MKAYYTIIPQNSKSNYCSFLTCTHFQYKTRAQNKMTTNTVQASKFKAGNTLAMASIQG